LKTLHIQQEGDHQPQRNGRAKERAVTEQGQAARTGYDRQGQVSQGLQSGGQGRRKGDRPDVIIPVIAAGDTEVLDVFFGAIERLYFTDCRNIFLQLGINTTHREA